MNKITSNMILKLLLDKHHKDFCVSECKTGASWSSNRFFMMDLWVMKKSWTQPFTYGYEIKVNRSDFLNDKKWQEYLKYCSDFYFVCPPGVIQPNELPPEAGLLITSINCKKLYTKKKTHSRINTKIPESLYRYLLMWRTILTDERQPCSAKRYWKEWIKNKKIDNELGHRVSRSIKQVIEKQIDKVRKENAELMIENSQLNEIKGMLIELGITPSEIRNKWYSIKNIFRSKIEKISQGDTGNFKTYLEDTKRNIEKAIIILEEKK